MMVNREKVERRLKCPYRCCVVTFIVFLLSLCIYPGDGFIKDVTKIYRVYDFRYRISHVSGVSLNYLPTTSSRKSQIVISHSRLIAAGITVLEHCLLIFHDNNNTITLKRIQR